MTPWNKMDSTKKQATVIFWSHQWIYIGLFFWWDMDHLKIIRSCLIIRMRELGPLQCFIPLLDQFQFLRKVSVLGGWIWFISHSFPVYWKVQQSWCVLFNCYGSAELVGSFPTSRNCCLLALGSYQRLLSIPERFSVWFFSLLRNYFPLPSLQVV